MALGEIDRRKVGFTWRDLNAGKNVTLDCMNFFRISGGDRDIGLRKPLDAWRVVSICHEEPTLSQYVNLPRHDLVFSLCFSGCLYTGANMNLSPELVLRHITRTQAFLYNAPAFRLDDDLRIS
ncbi:MULTISPECIES: hypothetical protein [unclassified Burkholderia]|uniref:hypothetical protein n=1 Tax=unclassified Burkholderia TaxID=2613784 RepID=UPI00211D8A8E|nr:MULTISPECIES: hypothetical protein [unclassified Burkholderia]